MTITNLGDTTSDQLRKLLEDNQVTIIKPVKDRFIIRCPECDKNEAYIYFNQKNRILTCNRKNNCSSQPIELWNYIADKQGIDPNKSFEILKYINQTLGLEFSQADIEQYNKIQEERNKKQEFFIHCNQIFSNALRDKNNPQVQFSLNYLKQTRRYTDDHIEAFKLGFFPNRDNLQKQLVDIYGYNREMAQEMMEEHFGNILNVNGKSVLNDDEARAQRITLTCYDTEDKIAGFIVRKPAEDTEKDKKYQYNQGMHKTDHLFNLNNLRFKDRLVKSLVIVEGQLDALTASHMSTQDVTDSYHFVASGGSSLSDNQAQLLKNKQFSQVTFFIDNDKAGENFPKSVAKLREYDITSFVVSTSKDYKDIKDIDQLLTEHPDVDLYAILENKKSAIEAELNIIKQSCSKDQNNIKPDERDRIIRECKRLNGKLLDSEVSQYKEYMKSNFDIDEPILNLQVPKLELSQDNNSTGNKKEEHPLIMGLKAEIAQVISESSTEPQPLDMHDYRRKVHNIQKALLKENIARDIKNDPALKASNNILVGIKKYNDLLAINYEEDKPYTWEKYVKEIRQNPIGLKTGFAALDEHVTIQPASLAFVAGRPSHGKTTMMLNMLRNMIKLYPDKAFLFYSYEEEEKAILSKLILSNINLGDQELIIEQEAENNSGDEYKNKSLLDKLQLHIGRYDSSCSINNNGKIIGAMNESVYIAKKEIEEWVKDERLQILDKKASVEILSGAIIERVRASNKPVAAIFIDYVQKLNTEVERPSRQQELQKICSTLLNTSQDQRVKAAIILGAQANREVKSSDGFNLHNMKDAGDIEQDANLVLGVWNPLAEQMQMLQSAINQAEMKVKMIETFCKNKDNKEEDLTILLPKKDEGYELTANDLEKLKKAIEQGKNKIKKLATDKTQSLTIKILKNRNGQKDLDISLSTRLSRFLITEVKTSVEKSPAAIARQQLKEQKANTIQLNT